LDGGFTVRIATIYDLHPGNNAPSSSW
jgi:hypothetical protein